MELSLLPQRMPTGRKEVTKGSNALWPIPGPLLPPSYTQVPAQCPKGRAGTAPQSPLQGSQRQRGSAPRVAVPTRRYSFYRALRPLKGKTEVTQGEERTEPRHRWQKDLTQLEPRASDGPAVPMLPKASGRSESRPPAPIPLSVLRQRASPNRKHQKQLPDPTREEVTSRGVDSYLSPFYRQGWRLGDLGSEGHAIKKR